MHTLTVRGRGLVAFGVVTGGLGWGLQQPALVATAVLLVVLPILAVVMVRRTRFVLGSSRTVDPVRLPVGDTGSVHLTIENGSRLPTGALLLEDSLPAALGAPAHVLLDRIAPRAQRVVRYPISGLVRGQWRVGPLTVAIADPFGMARVARSFTATNPVLVTPRIATLHSGGGTLSTGTQGEAVFRSTAARGDDDLLPREHRPGDDMRRIHWRATARHGELMVRREEQSWHSSATVILDDRATAHRGAGPTSTFEWAVGAAASICLMYQRSGWRVVAVTTSGIVLADTHTSTARDADLLLQAFAAVQPTSRPEPARLRVEPDGTTAAIAVMGHVAADAARTVPRPSAALAALLLLQPGPADLLGARGWQVAEWTPQASVTDVWAHGTRAPARVAR